MTEIGDRIEALESSTNSSLPSIQAKLKNIQHLIEWIKSGAPLLTRGARRLEHQKDQATQSDVQEDFTDNEEEEEALYRHVRKAATQNGKCRAHQLHLQATASD